ncbi:unnamed protein product [Schistosoma mattheei]|uniref:Tyrosine-protein phosphatase domain-containing protein n=1 Tax=Schistosoma mattheei TaxID=31246 RepID=A0A3P8HAT8_9TREM|nr:unnamed protein product [Schistosoma mattheei]
MSDNTYIHANWVDGYQCPRAYILAQECYLKTIFNEDLHSELKIR